MRTPIVFLALCLACSSPAFAQAGGHAHGVSPAPIATTQRWPTDAALRSGMREIRSSVDALAHLERGHMPAEQAAQLAGRIEAQVQDIVARCKLPPDADRALHGIIVPLLENAAALKADPKRIETIPRMRKALADYARQFDDPAFARGPGGSEQRD